jgi:hypothetical protein
VERLGVGRGREVKTAEAFEVCEYGSQPTKEELNRLFPFFGEPAGGDYCALQK